MLEEVGCKAHEHEELKEGVWLEPAPALLRKKVWKDRTEKHRNVARKMFLEGGWTQKKSMSSLPNGEKTRKAQALPLS